MRRNAMWLAPLTLLGFVALCRWPGLMPLNFSPVYALVLCAGAFRRLLPWWAVALTLVLLDVLLNVFKYGVPPFSDYQLVNYLAYALIFGLGALFSRRMSAVRWMGAGLVGAVIFYLVTNTAAWLQNPEYARSLPGWFQALTVGTSGWPETWTFFRNTLLSGGLFAGVFSAFLRAVQPAEQPQEQENEAAEPEAEVEPRQGEA